MKANDLLDILGETDDGMIAEAKAIKKNNIPAWAKWCAAAACLCLAIGGALFANNKRLHRQTAIDDSVVQPQEQAATEPYRLYTDRITLPDDAGDSLIEYDMIGCLVYKGSVYTQGSTVVDEAYAESLVGEYVGEAKGSLDEWSSQEEWATEFASTYSGPVYTVKGYDEDFRLCLWIETDNGKWLQIMENFDGIGLNTGNDLFEERFHVKNNIASVTYLTHYDWNYNGYDEHEYKSLDTVTQEQLDEFVDTLCESPFVRIDYDESPEFYDTEKQGHLFLKMNDGTQVELRLLDGGYVGYQGLGWFFVTMPGDIFETVLNACQ